MAVQNAGGIKKGWGSPLPINMGMFLGFLPLFLLNTLKEGEEAAVTSNVHANILNMIMAANMMVLGLFTIVPTICHSRELGAEL